MAIFKNPNWNEELTCTYLVACDGGKSTNRKKLGINFAGETHQTQQLWVGDMEIEGLTPDAWYNWVSPVFGMAFALFPFKDSTTWQLQALMPPYANGNVPSPTASLPLAGVKFVPHNTPAFPFLFIEKFPFTVSGKVTDRRMKRKGYTSEAI